MPRNSRCHSECEHNRNGTVGVSIVLSYELLEFDALRIDHDVRESNQELASRLSLRLREFGDEFDHYEKVRENQDSI